MSGAPATDASEVAQVLADVATDRQVVPDEAAEHLHRILGHSLASLSPGEKRLARLGLLIELVATSDGEYVDSRRYREARDERSKRGEDWPDVATLVRAYGHYLSAVRAASRFWFDGGSKRVPASYRHAVGKKRSYIPQEIVRGLVEARRDICLSQSTGPEQATDVARWPTEWEYGEWIAIRRALARRAGNPCRLAGPKQIRKAFGTYAAAVGAASAVWQRSQRRTRDA